MHVRIKKDLRPKLHSLDEEDDADSRHVRLQGLPRLLNDRLLFLGEVRRGGVFLVVTFRLCFSVCVLLPLLGPFFILVSLLPFFGLLGLLLLMRGRAGGRARRQVARALAFASEFRRLLLGRVVIAVLAALVRFRGRRAHGVGEGCGREGGGVRRCEEVGEKGLGESGRRRGKEDSTGIRMGMREMRREEEAKRMIRKDKDG